MATQANGAVDSGGRCTELLQDLSKYHTYLPSEICTAHVAEGEARQSRLLQLLSSEPAPPNTSELSFALRSLRSFEEQKHETSLETKVSLSLSLWRLLLASVSSSDGGVPLYGYTLRTKLAENLRNWLQQVTDEHLIPHWQSGTLSDDVTKQIESLQQALDVRVPVRLIIEEMRISPRTDCSVGSGKRRQLVSHLVNLSVSMSRFMGTSAGQCLNDDFSKKLCGTHGYTMLFARLIVLLTPLPSVPQAILDGRLWTWWSALPEGLVPKFDLMWFAVLARYSEIRWAGNAADFLAQTGSAGRESECQESVVKQLPWLLNKICRTLSLPFGSPAANAVERSSTQNPPDLDRYVIPEEIDQVVMGSKSTWKYVAKFIVYSLDASPPETPSNANMWSLLELLQRRMRPFLTPSNCQGDWLWHCVTLIHFLVLAYYKRACRERLLPCKAPMEARLTKEADQKFVGFMLAMTKDLMTARGPYEMATSLENLSRLLQFSAIHANGGALMEMMAGGPPDPFRVDLQSLIFQATETLNDPAQSDRHVALLHLCSSSLPALLLRMPATIGGLLPVTLWGIDPTDTFKTLVSMHLLVTVFSRIPCLDTNDWSSVKPAAGSKELQGRAAWRWPVPAGQSLQDDSEDSGTSIVASMLPSFAVEFVERICDYVTRIPKPAKGRGLQQGMGHLESACTGLMHGTVCLVASQCDKDTYKRMVEVVADFVRGTLLPDQVKPTGLLVSAIVRAFPEISLPIMLPIFFKKLLPSKGATSVALHDTGISESEAKWLLSLLAATVRTGGEALLGYRTELEAVMRAAFLDEREAVPKLGMKVLRRVLYSITSTYVKSDYRLCGSDEWTKLMEGRLGSGSMPPGSNAVLQWSGAQPPWWANDSVPKVIWHTPSEAEVAWARGLSFGVLDQVGKMLAAVPVKDVPPLAPNGMPAGSDWLQGLASGLPAKKKSSHAAVLAVRLAGMVLRGTCELWPDERSDSDLQERIIPANLAIAGDTGRVIFEWLADVLLEALKALALQEQYGSAVTNAGKSSEDAGSLDPIEVSRVIRKVLKCIGELLGALRETHPCGLRLFPSLRQVDLHAASMQLQATMMDGLHPRSKWRDLPRIWWVERIAEVMERRLHDRCGGHRHAGRRKLLLEAVCQQLFRSGFSAVRQQAGDVVTLASRYHIGSKNALLRDVLLPALADETAAALRCSSLTGTAADLENQRLNDSLSGLAASFGGGISGLVPGVWRSSVDAAAKVGLALCEAIYAATKTSSATTGYPAGSAANSGDGSKEQKCEVKSQTVAKLIAATKHWLDNRQEQLWGKTRAPIQLPGMEDQEQLQADSPPKGMDALATVNNALDICERADCHWRAQVMATTVCLALLNALGRNGVPDGATAEQRATAKKVWLRWASWLIKCAEPKGQPGLHSLAAHSLLLLMKRSDPLETADLKAIGLCDAAVMEKLLKILPQLHHDHLMAAGQDQGGAQLEPTKDSVTTMTHFGMFKLWPRVWVRKSSRAFSLRNALFWQSYVRLLANSIQPDALVEMLKKGAEDLASQPVAEGEYHAAFTELSAGALRALRKADTTCADLRRQAWNLLRPWILTELQQSSQERLEDWCDAMRFIATGCQRPLLKGPTPGYSSEAATEADDGFLIPVFNFVMGGEGNMPFDALSCTLPPVRFDYDGGAEASEVAKEGSSFDAFKRLRLLMALLVEPSATRCIQRDEVFCKKLAEVLQPGLGHPYKQLREEVSRALFLTMKAASFQPGSDNGLTRVATELESWLSSEMCRVQPMLQSDNAAHQKESDDNDRPRHVVESSGLCYVLLHAGLARMTSRNLRKTAPAGIPFLLAASAHGDFELRTLASLALHVCCLAHPSGPIGWEELPMVEAVHKVLSAQDVAVEKELEKLFGSALKPLIMANYFLLRVGSEEAKSLLTKLRAAAEGALGHQKPEIRSAVRGTVSSFLALDTEAEITSMFARMKTAAGPPPGKQSASAAVSDSVVTASVSTLACALLAAADCGMPKWSGRAIQALTPYGRPGVTENARKEVQSAIQAFLKLQQSSQRSWKEAQEKLTPAQLELLNDSKGKLSYFS
eukprot:TRINITY_DN18449_c0_g1_i1.p1 TRINITY_DN18449_c0_g1~~TRINITY_DN18449_c0_g1_i1.p1  ORF type:complete len:2089 (+),score=437.43 TRINITY_DN18449_c0_g1_i1:57-6269(+)